MVGGLKLQGHYGTTDFKGSHDLAEIQKSGAAPAPQPLAALLNVETSANAQVSNFLLGSISSTRRGCLPQFCLPDLISTSPRWNVRHTQLQSSLGNVVFSFLAPVMQKDKWKRFGMEVQKQLTISNT